MKCEKCGHEPEVLHEIFRAKHPLTAAVTLAHPLTLSAPPTDEQIKAWVFREECLIDLCEKLEERCEELASDLRHQVRNTSPEHVCGLAGYNGMIDPPCPACEASHAIGTKS